MSRGADGQAGGTHRPTHAGSDGPGDNYDGPGDAYDGERSGYDGPSDGHHKTDSYDGPKKYDGPTVKTLTLPSGRARSI